MKFTARKLCGITFDGDDSQNIGGLYGDWVLWDVVEAPFWIFDEFDVFIWWVLAAFEVVIPLYLSIGQDV